MAGRADRLRQCRRTPYPLARQARYSAAARVPHDLTAAGAERIYGSRYLRAPRTGRGWGRVVAFLREGDVLTVTKPERLARSTAERCPSNLMPVAKAIRAEDPTNPQQVRRAYRGSRLAAAKGTIQTTSPRTTQNVPRPRGAKAAMRVTSATSMV